MATQPRDQRIRKTITFGQVVKKTGVLWLIFAIFAILQLDFALGIFLLICSVLFAEGMRRLYNPGKQPGTYLCLGLALIGFVSLTAWLAF